MQKDENLPSLACFLSVFSTDNISPPPAFSLHWSKFLLVVETSGVDPDTQTDPDPHHLEAWIRTRIK
jgi:hypothetical protein